MSAIKCYQTMQLERELLCLLMKDFDKQWFNDIDTSINKAYETAVNL